MQRSPVLVIGASGFVGRHLCVTLKAAGLTVRRATSRTQQATSPTDVGTWVHLDLSDARTHERALEGCRSVVYLYHGLGTGEGYERREAAVAIQFRDAATRAGVERLVYLGGIVPREGRSTHLESRRITGEKLREGSLSAIELRAAMIIGFGSASFNLIRDLAVRMPFLVLPPWLDNASFPIAIDDVCYALARALVLPAVPPMWFELPGPERITHRELVRRLGELLGTRVFKKRLRILTPWLSARLLSIIGRERHELVSELVSGLPADLVPYGQSFWEFIHEHPERGVRDAILNALSDESSRTQPSLATEERLRIRGESLRGLVE